MVGHVPFAEISVAGRQKDFEARQGVPVIDLHEFPERLFQLDRTVVRTGRRPVTKIDDDALCVLRMGEGENVVDRVDDIALEPDAGRIANPLFGELHEYQIGVARLVVAGPVREVRGIAVVRWRADARRWRHATRQDIHDGRTVRSLSLQRRKFGVRVASVFIDAASFLRQMQPDPVVEADQRSRAGCA